MANITRYQTSKGQSLWQVRYRKPDGRQTKRRGFKRKIDAERWAAANVTIAKASGTYVDPQAGRTTVATLWDRWIAAKKVGCKASYADSLDREWRTRVKDKWGGRQIATVQRGEVQEWVAWLGTEERDGQNEITKKAMSASVILRAEGILSGILDMAVRDRLIPSNPCDGVELPRKKRKEHRYLTAAELLRLADAARDKRTLVLTLGLTGIRWGEMAGLTVADVDLKRRRLSIRRSATEVDHRIVVDTPKSDKWRSVVFPRILDGPLREACRGKNEDDLVFTGADGSYVRRTHGPNTRSSWFYWARKRAGIKGAMTVHDLRHTAASLMVHAGANVKAVQRQLGHAAASMTLDVYADLFDDDLDAVGDAMNRLLLENVPKMCPNETGEAA